jgi:hypothetical protein
MRTRLIASEERLKKLSSRIRSSCSSADFGSLCVLIDPGALAKSEDVGGFIGEAVRDERSGNIRDALFETGDSLIVVGLEIARLGASVRLIMLSSSSSSESGITVRCRVTALLRV